MIERYGQRSGNDVAKKRSGLSRSSHKPHAASPKTQEPQQNKYRLCAFSALVFSIRSNVDVIIAKSSAVHPCFTTAVSFLVGTWLSLVEHSLGVRGVGSSNLPVPTIQQVLGFLLPILSVVFRVEQSLHDRGLLLVLVLFFESFLWLQSSILKAQIGV
jgi:hypothetical protein